MTQSSSSEWQKNQRKNKNFQCPCGKSYLSYPALYTHIKQTHGGKAPGEIRRPDTHNRGRPKASGAARIQQHNKAIEQVLKVDPVPQLINLMAHAQVSRNRDLQNIYENEPVFKLIMHDIDKPFEPKFLKEDKIYDVKMGQGIILFLREIQALLQDKNKYDQIVMLIVLLTEHIIEQTEDQNVLNLGTIGLMPQFVNYFMIHDFKKPVQRLKLQNLWIFQNQNPIRIFNIFFKWMLYKKFTLTKVQINERFFHSEEENSQNLHESQNEEQQSNQNDDESEEQDFQEEKSPQKSESHQWKETIKQRIERKNVIELNSSEKVQKGFEDDFFKRPSQ